MTTDDKKPPHLDPMTPWEVRKLMNDSKAGASSDDTPPPTPDIERIFATLNAWQPIVRAAPTSPPRLYLPVQITGWGQEEIYLSGDPDAICRPHWATNFFDHYERLFATMVVWAPIVEAAEEQKSIDEPAREKLARLIIDLVAPEAGDGYGDEEEAQELVWAVAGIIASGIHHNGTIYKDDEKFSFVLEGKQHGPFETREEFDRELAALRKET